MNRKFLQIFCSALSQFEFGCSAGGGCRDSCCLFNGPSTWCEVGPGQTGQLFFLCLQKGHFKTSISAARRGGVSPHPHTACTPTPTYGFSPPLPLCAVCRVPFPNAAVKSEIQDYTFVTGLASSYSHFLVKSSSCLSAPRARRVRLRRGSDTTAC